MDNQKILNIARSVIEMEASAIKQMANRLNSSFSEACRFLNQVKGKIIVMGMGKSGHIGRKMAATFASTGSPAFFIHPGEAKHGDLGMVTRDDALIIVSNSGESEEIISLLPSLKRLSVPIIAMTGNAKSTLANIATLHLDVSVEKEACPLGLAPTSSTTVALVMGDALAMALLDLKGFTENDFALSHPGGSLGKRLLLKVEEIMHTEDFLPIISHDSNLKEALIEMTSKKLGVTTVINENQELVGIFTDGDVRRAFDNQLDISETKIREVMSKHPKTISADMLAREALTMMETYQITALIITDEFCKPKGVIHIHDILRAGIN